jgi:hypothetical protein
VTGSFTYTLAAPASAGGTQTITVAVGSCSGQIFYPQGVVVEVTQNVPTGYSVTAISISGGGSTISSSNAAAGSAAVTIGSSQSMLSFTTSAPPPPPPPDPDCKVPNVLGLGLLTAKSRVRGAGCTVGHVGRAYSRTFRLGRIMGESPKRGLVLAHAAPVDLVVSRGPRP